jgi:hypothetical protein
MATKPKSLQKATHGDFQTPMRLAHEVACLLKTLAIVPSSILEPTCGVGNLLFAATEQFPEAVALGREINPAYVACAIDRATGTKTIQITQGDFFETDWKGLLASLPAPVLLLGNPPWVTNTDQSKWDSANVPSKNNTQLLSGIEAITGKSNFDISEWMLSHLIENLQGKEVIVAMLCKTAVARKVLKSAWQKGIYLSGTRLYRINALADFDAAVDACLFFTQLCSHHKGLLSASIFPSLLSTEPEQTLTWIAGEMIANKIFYDRWEGLQYQAKNAKNIKTIKYQWRSGVKHDASAVMELRKEGDLYRNGHGEFYCLEDNYLYPLLKTSDIAQGRTNPNKFILVTQKTTKESTNSIAQIAPKTWEYLQKHAEQLNARGSSIYKNRPQFSIFGIGEYTFSPWKVAISGLYKKLHFEAIGPLEGKPTLVDDATYFLPCASEDEARQVSRLLNSVPAKEFLEAFIFWDAKRPITSELLGRLDISKLAIVCGEVLITSSKAAGDSKQQMSLFDT